MKRARHDYNEENQDRLSDLPDCVLLRILSFSNSKNSVQTCVLSKRWKHLWKHIPTLRLNSWSFSTKKRFATFVSQILTLRDSSTGLHAFDIERDGIVEPKLLKIILNYICSHNTQIQNLGIYVTADSSLILNCVSKCHALTSLKLELPRKSYEYTETLLPKSLNLPSLTSLHLSYFTFYGGESGCAEPFAAFTKLNSLVIRFCWIKDARILSISNKTLVDLTMVNISPNSAKIELYLPPSLCTFSFTGVPVMKICGNGCSSVKHVDINAQVDSESMECALVLLSWLQDLANAELLTVTSTTLQILSLVPDLLEVKLRSLCNLKSLKVRLKPLYYGRSLYQSIEKAMLKKAAAKSLKEAAKLRKAFAAGLDPPDIPDGTVDFLRQNSPSAEVKITGCFNLKQVGQFVTGSKNTSYNSHFVGPASVAPPNLQLCPTEKDDASSNEDKVEIPQPNTNSALHDNGV